MRYSKSFLIEGNADRIQSSLVEALKRKGFAVENSEMTIRARRGSGWAKLYSFDITKYKTSLEVSIEMAGENKQKVSFTYDIGTAGALPTPADDKALSAEIDTILGGLK